MLRRRLKKILTPNQHALEMGVVIYSQNYIYDYSLPKVGAKFTKEGHTYICTKIERMVQDSRKMDVVWGRKIES